MLKYSADEIRKYQLEQKKIAQEAVEKIVEPVANKILEQIREAIAANPDLEVIHYDIEKEKIYYEEGMGTEVELIEMKYEPQLTKALEAGGFEVDCFRNKTDGKGRYSVGWYLRPHCPR